MECDNSLALGTNFGCDLKYFGIPVEYFIPPPEIVHPETENCQFSHRISGTLVPCSCILEIFLSAFSAEVFEFHRVCLCVSYLNKSQKIELFCTEYQVHLVIFYLQIHGQGSRSSDSS